MLISKLITAVFWTFQQDYHFEFSVNRSSSQSFGTVIVWENYLLEDGLEFMLNMPDEFWSMFKTATQL